MVSDVVKLRSVLSGPYLYVYSNGKCSACISGLLKGQILSLLAIKKIQSLFKGRKSNGKRIKGRGGGEEEIFHSAKSECSQC